MTSVLLDTLTVTTDPLTGLASDKVSHTNATVKFTNPSKASARFRVVSSLDGEFTVHKYNAVVDANQQGEITVFPLAPGTSTKLYLERYEVDRWVRQTSTSSLDYVLVSTPTSNLSVSVGSTSAKVTFPMPVSDARYYVILHQDQNPKFKKQGTVLSKGGSGTVFFDGLKKNQKYTVQLGVKFPESFKEQTTEEGVDLHFEEFTTSQAAEMVVTGPFASYMGIDWSASVDGRGSNYRIVNRVDGSDDVLVESSTETKATVQDLQPGSGYKIVLQRAEFGGKWSDQSEVLATTLTSSLSLGSVASRTMELAWTSLYPGASFEILYSAGSGPPVGSGQTQELSAVLRGLEAGTDYQLDLVVYELGQAVGLARLGMTTNNGLFSPKNIKMGGIALIIILVAFLLKKKR